MTIDRARRTLFPALLDYLLRAEPTLRRQRRRVAWLIGALFLLLAAADALLWPQRSFAPGYVIPVALGAYAFGLRVGAGLSILGVVLRTLCAGRTYGPWWVYAGSALALGEYLMLATGVALLGRAVRRLERHTQVLGNLSDDARELTRTLTPAAILGRGVEAGVRLTGADGGFMAIASEGRWQVEAVCTRSGWVARPFVWWPHPTGPWEGEGRILVTNGHGATAPNDLAARTQLAVPVWGPETRPGHALVVYRAAPRAFARPTQEALEVLALNVASALNTAALYGEALRASEEKARMLAAVAHDLRNPLHAILWDADTLRARNGTAGKEIGRLSDNALLALDLVRTLQDFAEIEGRQLGVQLEQVSLATILEDLRALMEPLLAGRPIEFRCALGAGAGTLFTDRCLLHRVLANLLANAAKFTERGTIELRAERVGDELALAVGDTGPGISPDDRARIFMPFVRGEAQPVGGPRGMGLGLAIAAELTHLLDGRLDVESALGQGSTFRLRLPLARRVPAEAREEPVPTAVDAPTERRGCAVMLVEQCP